MIQRYFGIDAAASTLQGGHLFKRQKSLESFANDETGWEQVFLWAKKLCPNGQLRFCIEHTGGYELGVVRYLQSKGVYVSVIDGARLHHYALGLGKKAKTDASDALVLARYARERRPVEWVAMPDLHILHLQLSHARDSYVKQQTVFRNQSKAPGVLPMVREHLDLHLAALAHTITQIEAQMLEIENQLPRLEQQIKVLDTVTGIGRIQARQLLVEIGDIANFAQARNLGLASGLAPIPRRSGTSINKRSLPTYGNSRLRSAIMRAAVTAKRTDPAFMAFAARIAGNGNKSAKTVNTACGRKMAHVVWAVLTYNIEYDPKLLMKQSRLT